jgi:hypothetical protein
VNTAGLLPYQVPHVDKLLRVLQSNKAALDGSDTGTGKTFTALATARALGIKPFVITPLVTVPSWLRASESLQWPIQVTNYEKARGPGFHTGPDGKRAPLSVSPWGFERPAGAGSQWVWNNSYRMLIFDEVDRCSGSTSLNSKLLIAAKRQAQHVLTLSATAAESPLQLKALGYALGLHNLKSWPQWLLRHGCTPGIFGGYEFSKNSDKQLAAMEKLHRQIFESRGARMRRKEIPGFPKSTLGVKLVQLEESATDKADELSKSLEAAYLHRMEQADEARRQAEEEKERCIAEGIEYKGGGVLTEILRIQQGLEMLLVAPLLELALQYSKTTKVAIFVNFLETVDKLAVALSDLKIGVITGQYNGFGPWKPAARQDVADAFQRNELEVVIVSRAGGVGLSLHDPKGEAERTSLICPQYSARAIKQVLGRVDRAGGAYSQQFFVYIFNSKQREIALTLEKKLNNLDMLNDRELYGSVIQ